MALSLGLGIGLTPGKGGGAWWPEFTDFALEFGNRYMLDGERAQLSDLTFTRSSAAEVITGARRTSFASGAPRVVSGALIMDGGATNGLPHPEDIGNAAWVKTNVTVGSVSYVDGGDVPFWPLKETATSGGHNVRGVVTSNATDWLGVAFLRADGRASVRGEVFGTQTNSGARVTWTLEGSGSSVAVGGTASGIVLGHGCVLLSDDIYMVWVIGRAANQTHTTASFQISLLDSNGNASYAGDTSKGLLVGPCMLSNLSEFRSYTASSRAAETMSIPLDDGVYAVRVRDSATDDWRGFEVVSGGSYTLTPNSGRASITKVEGYRMDFYKDWSADSDTSDGDVPGFDLRGPYVSSYPLPAATKGRVSGGKVVADQGDVVYITKVLSEPVHFMGCAVSWSDTGGAGAEASAAMFSTSDPNIISNMPHHTFSRDRAYIGNRVNGGPIVVLDEYNFSPNPNEAGALFDVYHSTTATGRMDMWVRDLERFDHTDPDLGDGGATPVGTRAVWEIYQPSATAGNTIRFHKVAARYRPVNLAA